MIKQEKNLENLMETFVTVFVDDICDNVIFDKDFTPEQKSEVVAKLINKIQTDDSFTDRIEAIAANVIESLIDPKEDNTSYSRVLRHCVTNPIDQIDRYYEEICDELESYIGNNNLELSYNEKEAIYNFLCITTGGLDNFDTSLTDYVEETVKKYLEGDISLEDMKEEPKETRYCIITE